jgi:glycosyltransferase involved in cell wall biosynthesis
VWDNKKVSVALPTYNEKESIRVCIDDFFRTGVVDEVVVCNNNAAPGTSAEVAQTRAREVFEPRQGYGWSCRKALAETTGDLVILSEPDGSFRPRDVFKLLAYASDFDVVQGSRTNREFIWTGANMGWFMKWGNWAVAKYIEVLFNTTSLTDVGCTMRLFHREVLDGILPGLAVGGSHLGPEMILRCVARRARMVEVPLHYGPRTGTSSVTGNRWKALGLGCRMIAYVTGFRAASWVRAVSGAVFPR